MDTQDAPKVPEEDGAAAAAGLYDTDFDAGWGAGADAADDPAAGRKAGEDPGTAIQPSTDENGAGGADEGQPPAAAGVEQDAGDSKDAGAAGDDGSIPPGSAAGAAETTKDTPPAVKAAGAKDGSKDPPKKGDDAPKEGTLEARFAKMERDTKAEIGRVRKENRELREALQGSARRQAPPATPGKTEGSPGTERAAALLEKLKDPLEKIRDYDEGAAEVLETVTRELSTEISASEQRVQERAQQSEVDRRRTDEVRLFDDAFPDGSYNDLLRYDEQGQLTNPEFLAFVNALPFSEARTFYETNDARAVISVLQKFTTRDDPPAGDGSGADPPPKTTNDTPRRRAQAQAGAAVAAGKSGAVDPPPSDGNSFDAGWAAEDGRIRRINKDMSESRRAFA